MQHVIFIVMDSARYDAVVAARTPNLDRIGPLQRRWSYASWTAPSHHALLMGLMPHASPRGVFASEVYKDDFVQWQQRLGVDDLSFSSFVPTLNLPGVLRKLGYRTSAFVSLPVLNPWTTLSTGFDRYELWPRHDDFAGMLEQIDFPADQPAFWFLNLGETHYPYMLRNGELPHLHGVHGVYKRLDDHTGPESLADTPFFDDAAMARLREQQIRCVEHLDGLFGRLFEQIREPAWIVVTADHGELFGEGGYFGHGPVMHEKVFEVPFVEGPVPTG